MKNYFQVLERMDKEQCAQYDKNREKTEHLKERAGRINTYREVLGAGIIVDGFIVDKVHRNGNEVHILKNNRLIEVYNESTMKLITVLYARPEQLRRYYSVYEGHSFDVEASGLFERFEHGLNLI